MADPVTYRPKPGEIPTSPGVYRFSDQTGRIIYVGKAKNLRNRLSNYFADPASLHPRTAQMVQTACHVQWTVVTNELEALALEYSWIKEFRPRFNVMFKDDKSYPYLAVSLGEEYPRVKITREAKRPKVKYFGPYAQVWAIRETLDLLTKVFPVRTCSQGVFNRARRQGRPCLMGYIEKCSAPCVGRISASQHRQLALDLCAFMAGKTGQFETQLQQKMAQAAENLEYEDAAKYRDQLAALEKVLEKNAVVLPADTNADVFGLFADDLEVAVQLFHVRGGRVRGVRSWIAARESGDSAPQLMETLLGQVYGDAAAFEATKESPRSVDDVAHPSSSAIPKEVLVPVLPANAPVIQDWLSQLRGSAVDLRVPRRGDKRALAATVSDNAKVALRLHRSRQVADLTQRGQALEDLAKYLGLPAAPLRIEGYDISHTAGTNQVGSMVVFEDGAPRKDAYRSFNILENAEGASDDTAAMQEVLRRRFQRLLAEEAGLEGTDEAGEYFQVGAVDLESGKPRRFSYRPQLVVVDGGLPQVNAAAKVLAQMDIQIPVVGLAKRLEEVWIPGDEFPVILPRQSAALYLLQHLRDESHRFAIGHHRKRRAKAMTRSVLDEISGLGPARQTDLLRHFGSVKRLKEATVEQICQVRGIGPVLAQQIWDHLNAKPPVTKVPPGEAGAQ